MASNDLLTFILEDWELSKNLLTKAVHKENTEIIIKMLNCFSSIYEKEMSDCIVWRVICNTTQRLTPKVFEILLKNLSREPFEQSDDYDLLGHLIDTKRNDLLEELFEKYDIDPLKKIKYHNFKRDLPIPPLFITLINENYDAAELLMKHGADINQICAPAIRYPGYHPYADARYEYQPSRPLCYQAMRCLFGVGKEVLVEFMLNNGADLSDPGKLRECCENVSIIKKIEDFYKEPKKRAKPDQD